ncbi:MAG TPA: 1-deoxy-D-xylulose-5-phosphate reductoisomerase [Thiobacillaceae bacterium]|nr:1-deoxy-D-xylulose-5-phosphate reductoisomerase [Thiobacillaceae bacterium]HNA82021.1 1-deoxy-D-xylulose-5-phosphate reductoisomerase [Thiobacillaceae bacterium]HNF89024.1 1-deoxy-D-xylulose-5-phosphate reductoisomerase [Thiobacillaceae bacterium]HNH89184.1 1-deoxy-D-xylulose-5-phosphate reductoisomerase [Thiobacillaceae bacterium]HNI08182.1 1-deoxy-D-xylulose-5-phosphate reductoisomerase [Thiobacillaceae bacterium]
MTPHNLTILGATGTIGVNTLDVVARHPERFRVVALTGQNQIEKLAEQCHRFRPRYAVVLDNDKAGLLQDRLRGTGIEVLVGVEALEYVSSLGEVDSVMAAIVGAAGLRPALAAAKAGKRVLLANKETLVMAGRFFMEAVHRHGATLLPIDSEHNAVFQSLPGGYKGDPASHGVRRVLLTASGGPFRTRALESLHEITPEEAVAHPNWVMGKKISVDSATMMNKGLEVIEARWLFDARPDQIEVVIHPQSIIHSMVEYLDGSVLAQLSNPDMRTPIAHSLAYPERVEAGVPWLDLAKIGTLTFESPDLRRFPCLGLAYEALAAGGAATAMLNAANEEAVAAFLDRRIPYLAIAATLDKVLQKLAQQPADSLEQLLEADAAARRAARAIMAA